MRGKSQFKLGFRVLATSVEVRVCYTRFYGAHNLCWARARGARGARQGQGSETGSEGVRQGVRGVRQGVRGSEGSEVYVILGFTVPTIYDKRKFDQTTDSGYVSPPPSIRTTT